MAGGYVTWEPQFILDRPWLGDRYLTGRTQPISWNPLPSLTVIGTHGHTHVLQKPYLPNKPDLITAYAIRYAVLADAQADYDHINRLWSAGAKFNLCVGARVRDTFSGALVGEVKSLGRPVATDGTVTGVDEISHPTEIYLDGVRDDSSATILGQSVTINMAGVIEVLYTPLFRVMISELPHSIAVLNDLALDLSMREMLG